MLVVMLAGASPEQIARVINMFETLDLTPHQLPSPTRTAIGITGNTGVVYARLLEVLEGVKECIRVTKPYKLASRKMHAGGLIKAPKMTSGECHKKYG